MARGRKSSIRIVLSPDERATLAHWQRSTTMAAGLVRRGRLILLLADGYSHSQVARLLPVQRTVVRKWARRFLAQRLAPWRTTVRWTPTACATADGAWPAANQRIIFPRRTRPAVRIVDRGQRSKAWPSSGARTRRREDLRPRAIAISSQECGEGWRRDTGTLPQSQANLDRFS